MTPDTDGLLLSYRGGEYVSEKDTFLHVHSFPNKFASLREAINTSLRMRPDELCRQLHFLVRSCPGFDCLVLLVDQGCK